jgi:hypothetical protein
MKKYFWSLHTDVKLDTISSRSNWVENSSPLHSMMETDPVSKTLCLKKLKMMDNAQYISDV